MDQMRLIMVLKRNRNIGPVNYITTLNSLDHLLKSLDPTEALWTQPRFLSKQFDEVALAETDDSRHLTTRNGRITPKFFHGVSDCAMVLQWTSRAAQQPLLKNAELSFDGEGLM